MQSTYWHKFSDAGIAAACGAVVKVWDPSNPNTEVKIFEGTSVYAVAFNVNNKILAVGGDKCQVSLYSCAPQPDGDRKIAQLPPVPGRALQQLYLCTFPFT
jgi:WD40 repeat protein